MRFGRILIDGAARWVHLDADGAQPWSDAPYVEGSGPDGAPAPAPDESALLPPVTPSKILCVGRNYRKHAEELGNEVPDEPLLFLKPPSALLGNGRTIAWPAESERVDFEGEVGVVIGRRVHRASQDEAAAAVFAITCANDVTARDLQRKDGQFTRGKGFDGFCPVGPWLETALPPLDAIGVTTRVDGRVRQDGNTRQMVWGIADLLAFMSGVMTLEPGDLVLTGTPEGVGPLAAGERVEIEIEGVGVLASVLGARLEA